MESVATRLWVPDASSAVERSVVATRASAPLAIETVRIVERTGESTVRSTSEAIYESPRDFAVTYGNDVGEVTYSYVVADGVVWRVVGGEWLPMEAGAPSRDGLDPLDALAALLESGAVASNGDESLADGSVARVFTVSDPDWGARQLEELRATVSSAPGAGSGSTSVPAQLAARFDGVGATTRLFVDRETGRIVRVKTTLTGPATREQVDLSFDYATTLRAREPPGGER